MSDKLPKSVYRDIDYDRWDNFLMKVDKEKLVDFMLSRMSTDDHFMSLVYEYFNSFDDIATADDLIKAYLTEMDYECSNFIPDVDYIVSLTDRFMQLGLALPSLYSKIQLYVSLIVRLDKEVSDDGAGVQGDDDFLIVDMIKNIDKDLMKAICDKKQSISDEEREEICGFIKTTRQEYTISLLDDDYLEKLAKEFE